MIVPEEAKQTALIRVQDWTWIKHTIWTDHMLEALGNGVKGSKNGHKRWPNTFFASAGLFTLSEAWDLAIQSR